jgi:hypothetical protein
MTRKPRKSRSTGRPPRKTRKPIKPPKALKRDPLYEFIEAGTRALNIKIEKAWLRAIGEHLLVTWRHGVVVAVFPLPDDAEPAPVFES